MSLSSCSACFECVGRTRRDRLLLFLDLHQAVGLMRLGRYVARREANDDMRLRAC